jgi:hypothetical protein
MQLRVLCIALVAVAVGLFAYRWQILDYPVLPDQDSSVWQIEAQIDLEGRGDGARVGVFVPPEDGRFGPIEEDFVADGLALTTVTDAIGNRSAVWSSGTLEGRSSVVYRARFYRLPPPDGDRPATAPPDRLPEDKRLAEPFRGSDAGAAAAMLAAVADDAPDRTTLVGLLLERLGATDADPNAAALIGAEPDDRAIAVAAARMLAGERIPARVVNGLPLEDARQTVRPIAWLEVWTDGAWQAFAPSTGDPIDPVDRLVWWRGSGDLVAVDGATVTRTSVALLQQQIGSVVGLSDRGAMIDDPLSALTLLDLPVNTQRVFQILLMIPVGALILVVFRQMVGLPTLGTFMPVLIALAFQVTDLLYGIVFFTLLVVFGLAARYWFSKLNLLLVPRLASMLVVVILLMIGMTLLADAVSLGLGLSVALFPIVILTMTIERLSVTLEESGTGEAVKEALGSLVVAVVTYAAMSLPVLQHLLFVFPELLLLVLAATLLLGRYSGYRLSELRRFRDLAPVEPAGR